MDGSELEGSGSELGEGGEGGAFLRVFEEFMRTQQALKTPGRDKFLVTGQGMDGSELGGRSTSGYLKKS